MKDYEVIAFDIDGTLYPSWRLNIVVLPYFLSHLPFFLRLNAVRKTMRQSAPSPDFFEYQARLLAEKQRCTPAEAKAQIQTLIYDGLKPYFEKIKTFKYVEETFQKLKAAGYRIALLSDFPPEQKGSLWGLIPYCELMMGTEEIGALKPSKYPFGILAMKLKVTPDKILYVGNSKKYDVIGARNAGLKTAYLQPLWKRLLHIPCHEADISFGSYRQFQKLVLQ